MINFVQVFTESIKNGLINCCRPFYTKRLICHVKDVIFYVVLPHVFSPGFARFTRVKNQTCGAPKTMDHLPIHINCPSTANTLSDCYFENRECTGSYVWLQCENFVNTNLPASLSYTPNSAYSTYPTWQYIYGGSYKL